jgi:hypothetical protein
MSFSLWCRQWECEVHRPVLNLAVQAHMPAIWLWMYVFGLQDNRVCTWILAGMLLMQLRQLHR